LVCGQLFSSLFFFDFHRTNLRIPPDLSPVSIRLVLLFLLLTRGARKLRATSKLTGVSFAGVLGAIVTAWWAKLILLGIAAALLFHVAFRSPWTIKWPIWRKLAASSVVLTILALIAWEPISDEYRKLHSKKSVDSGGILCEALPAPPARDSKDDGRLFVQFTADALGEMYLSGGQASVALYEGKWLRFSGPVASIAKMSRKPIVLVVRVDLGPGCFVAALGFPEKWENQLSLMKPRDVISADCKINAVGPKMVTLTDCELI
jgi:hypothetical protein